MLNSGFVDSLRIYSHTVSILGSITYGGFKMTMSKHLALYSRGCAVRILGEGWFCWDEQEGLA